MTGRISERRLQGPWHPLAPGERFELAEGALHRVGVAAQEDVRASIVGLDEGARVTCYSTRSGLWLLVRRHGAIGTPRPTLDWLSAGMLATAVALRRGSAAPVRVTRDPRTGAVRTLEENDFAVVWLLAGGPQPPPALDAHLPARWVSGRDTIDVAAEAVVLSEAAGDAAVLWIDPPGCKRVAATGAPLLGPGAADAAARIQVARATTSLTGLCDALAEGGHRAFALRHEGARLGVLGTAPQGHWALPGPDAREVDPAALAQLPRAVPLLCLANDRTPWAAVHAGEGAERLTLVFPLPPGGVAPVFDVEVASRLATLLSPHPRPPLSPWHERTPTPDDERIWGFERAAWAAYAEATAALVRAREARLLPVEVAALALEQWRRSAFRPLPPGALGDLLHALALAWSDESLSAFVAAAEIVSVLAPLGRQRLADRGLAQALRAALRCPADLRGDERLPALVRALRAQEQLPEGDLAACAALAGRLAKDKRFKALVVVARVAAALAPSRAEGTGRVLALPGDDVVALPCARTHARCFEETGALPDDEQVAARVLDYAPQVLPALRAQAGAARCLAVAAWLDARFPRSWSEAAQAALRGP